MAATVFPPIHNNRRGAHSRNSADSESSTVRNSRYGQPTLSKNLMNRYQAGHLPGINTNVLLLSKQAEPEWENTSGKPGKMEIYNRLVTWAQHRDRLASIQPKIDTWKDMSGEELYKRQQREAWYRERLRGLEEIARKNSYANRLLAAVKPVTYNHLSSAEERMRKTVFNNKARHSADELRLMRIEQDNRRISNRLQTIRTSFDFKQMDKDFHQFMKHRDDRIVHRRRQEQREIDSVCLTPVSKFDLII